MTTILTPATTAPACFSMLFESGPDYARASLRIRSHCALGTITTVLHEHVGGVDAYTITYDADFTLSISDAESLTIIARREGMIIGCGVFEVDVDLAVTLGAVLHPRSLSNLLVDQCEAQMVSNSIVDALKHCTDPLASLDETEQAVML